MRILGFDITRTKAGPPMPINDSRAWWPVIRESFTGAWQRNVEVKMDSVMSFHADFACRTLIASDIAKLRIKLVQREESGIWTEVENPAYSPVLRKPNHFQTRAQFIECWVLSKLQRGNSYILKERDGREVVSALYVLDPNRVKPLVTQDGDVYYQLANDNIAGLATSITVPASEIIHDRFNCMFHPLVGVSPIFANGLASTQGLNIQNLSAKFFANDARPSGILTAPGKISQPTADRLKTDWQQGFGGQNIGKVAVLGDGLKYERMSQTAVEGQLIEQLKWTAEVVCSTYHVPPYKIGVGEMPKFSNVQALNIEYYSQALQRLIEDIEACLDEGLSTGLKLGTEFDTENLLRMDSVTQADVIDKLKSVLTPDEQRAKLDKPSTPGGDVVYRQQQDFSLAALAKRDAKDDPFAKESSGAAPAAVPVDDGSAKALADIRAELAAANDNLERLAALNVIRKELG